MLTKFHLVKAMVFLVVMYRCETWIIKKAERQRFDAFELLLEKTFESPLACKEIQPGNPKGNQSWIFIGRTDAVAETSILWLPDAKNWLIGKDPATGKDWRYEEKGTTEDEMVGWHHHLVTWACPSGQFQQSVPDRETWFAAVCEVAKSESRLSDWTELYCCC